MQGLKAAIFDWAGTTVDCGCMAPVNAFTRMFNTIGIQVKTTDVRRFMGMSKLDHTRELFALEDVAAQFAARNGRPANEDDILALYAKLEPAMETEAARCTQLIPGITAAVGELRGEGVKIGSCTGYTKAMMQRIVAEAATQGYSPDAVVVPEEVGTGRPDPAMIRENFKRLGLVIQGREAVKVGDTVSDIVEGRNAGCWTVGWIICGNEMGLSENEMLALPRGEFAARTAAVAERLLNAGADYVAADPAHAYGLFRHIDRRIIAGERPGEARGIIWPLSANH